MRQAKGFGLIKVLLTVLVIDFNGGILYITVIRNHIKPRGDIMTTEYVVKCIKGTHDANEIIGLHEVAESLIYPVESTQEEFDELLHQTAQLILDQKQGSEFFDPQILDNVLILMSAAYISR